MKFSYEMEDNNIGIWEFSPILPDFGDYLEAKKAESEEEQHYHEFAELSPMAMRPSFTEPRP